MVLGIFSLITADCLVELQTMESDFATYQMMAIRAASVLNPTATDNMRHARQATFLCISLCLSISPVYIQGWDD